MNDMNEMDLLTRFRAEVPPGVSPRAEELFRAGIEDHSAERVVVPAHRHGITLPRLRLRWRLVIAAGLAAGLTAGLVAAIQPSGTPPVLTARLLAERASAAALTGPEVPAGKWVYQQTVIYSARPSKHVPARFTQGTWSTADGSLSYNDGIWTFGSGRTLYSRLGSFPHDPAALNEYLARLISPHDHTQAGRDAADFTAIEDLLGKGVLPPSLNAELYQALGDIPAVKVKNHVTDIAGRAGVAFVLPATPRSSNMEIILGASDYRYLAQAAWQPSDGSPNSAIPFTESALLRTTLVSGPGSTAADPGPPSQAELAMERVARAVLNASAAHPGAPLPDLAPGQWIYRKIGTREVWARADDAVQASYVNGTLMTCARAASCAGSTRWLMSAGPAYPLVDPAGNQPRLTGNPPELLAELSAYRTGCTDTAGYCDAVSVLANMLIGYGNPLPVPPLTWYLTLAAVPGVTVGHVTDTAGRPEIEFRFPFTSGVTGILLDASTYRFAGYVKDGAQTLLLRQANVAGPGIRP
jgi:hypothetical protein